MIFSFKTKKKLVQLHSFKDESQEKNDKINFIMHKINLALKEKEISDESFL